MSDTTTNTITPEERAEWRRVAATAELCCLRTIPFPHSDVTRLLDALEAAETRAEEAEAENARLAADMQAVRVILRDFWQLIDLGGESWGRSFRGHLAEIAMGLLDLHFEHNDLLRAEYEKDPEAFADCLWERIQHTQQEAARRAVAGDGEVRE